MARIITRTWSYQLEAEFGHCDLTPEARRMVSDSGITDGLLTVQLIGSTGAITTIEYEQGVLQDLRRTLELLAPIEAEYAHDARWGDGNGFSHVRSALLKTFVSLPVLSSSLGLGTWQQLVVLNLDNRPRRREVVGLLMGE